MPQITGKIPVGISSCLLGQPVRYDGGHRHDRLISRELADLFEFQPFCPEVAIGLGIPREPIQLINTAHGIRAQGIHHPSLDVTDQLAACGSKIGHQLDDICGYIFKARSPSCGVASVKTWWMDGTEDVSNGTGLFAAALMCACPDLPVTDERQLHDPDQRRQFIDRVRIRYRPRTSTD